MRSNGVASASSIVTRSAERQRGRGDLGADEAAADHDQARARDERLAEGLRVDDGAQRVHAGRRREREPSRPRAGREHERVPVELLAGRGRRRAGRPRRRRRLVAETQVDLPLGPVGRGAQQELVLRLRAGEELLRERRPLVRRQQLVADDDEAAVVALGAKRLGAARAGETRSDHENRAGDHQAAFSSKTVIAAIGHAAAASSTAGSDVEPARDGGEPVLADLDHVGRELGARAEAAAQRAVDLDPVHRLLLSSGLPPTVRRSGLGAG